MALAPSIFISATSSDLHSARDVVAKILTAMGYTPVWQDMAATDAGNLSEVLRSWIKPCTAVIQLVGFRYGAEPRQPDPTFGRASYTQLEALYAEQIKKRVIYIFLPEDFPTDACQPESPEKVQLQADYRQRLKDSGVLRHSASSPLELENRILRVRDELALLRAEMEKSRRRLWWTAAVGIVLLGAIAFGVWKISKSSQRQEGTLTGIKQTGEEQKKTLSDLEENSEKQIEASKRLEAKIEEIRSLPAGLRADRLASALSAANVDELISLVAAGITPSEVQNALARKEPGSDEYIADLFFRSSRNSTRAIDWLKQELKNGLDPNSTVADPYFEQKAILLKAMKAGNSEAAIALLEGGASPHPYEGLSLTTNPIPAFLFPFSYLKDVEAMDAGDKASVAKALQNASAVTIRYQPGSTEIKGGFPDSVSEQRKDVETIFREAPRLFGIKLEETPSLGQKPDSSIAQAAGASGEPWRNFIKSMPLRLLSEKQPDFGPYWLEVRNFIGTYFGRGYFIGTAFDEGEGPEYALIEISKDFRTWNVYLHIGTRAQMGFAKDENGRQSPGSRDHAWRQFDFKYDPDKKEMLLRDYYHYTVTRDLSAPLKPL